MSRLINVTDASRQLIDFGSHFEGINGTWKCDKESIDDYEANHRKAESVVLLHVFLVTFSTDDVDVFTLRSTTAEIIPGLADFHVDEYADWDGTDQEP